MINNKKHSYEIVVVNDSGCKTGCSLSKILVMTCYDNG